MSRANQPGPNDRDDSIGDGFTQVAALWSQADGREPPRELDHRVLAMARKELQSGRRRRSWPWTGKWTHHLATASVVVLAITVLVQLREQPSLPSADDLETHAAPLVEPMQQGRRAGTESRATGMNEMPEPADLPAAAIANTRSDEPQNQDLQQTRQRLNDRQAAPPQAETLPPAQLQAVQQKTMQAQVESETLAEESAEMLSDQPGNDPEDIHQWLQLLEDLHQQGNQQELANQLERFRARFPEYELPSHLSQ